MPTSGAVHAAATGIRPEKSVARSAPIRRSPMYQHTKPTTVTTAACHSSAAASVASRDSWNAATTTGICAGVGARTGSGVMPS